MRIFGVRSCEVVNRHMKWDTQIQMGHESRLPRGDHGRWSYRDVATCHAKEMLGKAETREVNRVSEGEDDTDSRYQRDEEKGEERR